MQNRVVKSVVSVMLVCLSLWSLNSLAITRKMPLPAEQAFIFSATVNHPHEILAEWRIAPGYILYAKRLHITVLPNSDITFHLPKAEMKHEPGEGDIEVYAGKLIVPVHLKTSAQSVQLQVDYQGCSKAGFCYPPMHKDVTLQIKQMIGDQPHENFSLHALMTDQNGIQYILQAQSIGLLLLIFAGLGLLLAFTPCVLPMIPILTSIIVGQKQSVTTRKAFILSSTYVLGTAITYACAGLAVAYLGSSLQVLLQQPWIIAIVSGLFVLLSLSLFGLFELQLPRSWQNRLLQLSHQQQGGTYAGVFCMGVLSTLIVSPCVTAPLVGVLMYIAHTGNLVLGASALFVMAVGMGIPLILIGVSAGKWLPKRGPWMVVVKKSFGILMLLMAVWLSSRILPIATMTNLFHGNQLSSTGQSFKLVRNVDELKIQLAKAKATHQPVVLDFYADWCDSCLSMDKKVFGENEVRKELTNYVLLRADLTQNSAADQALLKQYEVVAPPTVIFFDAKGHEIISQRIVGEVDSKEFLTRLTENWSQLALKK